MQEAGLGALSVMLSQALDETSPDEPGKLKATAIAILPSVMESMRTHEISSDVQRNGCRILGELAQARIDEIPEIFAASGGIEALICAMRRHEGKAEIQGEGCRGLTKISMIVEGPEQIVAQGGVETVISAMEVHRDCGPLCAAGRLWTAVQSGTQRRNTGEAQARRIWLCRGCPFSHALACDECRSPRVLLAGVVRAHCEQLHSEAGARNVVGPLTDDN
eukprot:660284-Rhodomonas_salina.1